MIKIIHIAFELWGCIFCLIAAVCIWWSLGMEAIKRKLLLFMQLGTSLLLLMDVLAWGFRGYPGPVGFYMVRISNFLVFIITVVIMILFHGYVCSYIFGSLSWKGISWEVKLVYLSGAAGILLIILSQFNGMYYYFDADNIYHRNWLYPLSMVPAIIEVSVDVSLLIRYRKQIKERVMCVMLSYLLLPSLSVIVQTFYYGISFETVFYLQYADNHQASVQNGPRDGGRND